MAFANGLKVLRRVDGIDSVAAQYLDDHRHLIEMEDRSLWVDNDQVWDAEIARYIHQATGGYIVTDADNGRLAGPYRDLQKAEAAARGAKVQIVSIVDDLDDEPELELAATGPARGRGVKD